MTEKSPRVTAKELVNILGKKGFVKTAQKGSHIKLRHRINKQRVIIPVHSGKILAPKLLMGILKDAGITVEELKALI